MRRLWPTLIALLGLTLLAAAPASAAVAASIENRASGLRSGSNNLIGIEPRLSEEAVREKVALAYEVASDDAVAARGVAADAKFAQATFGKMFSAEGTFAGKSVQDVAAALRSGAMKVSDVPVNYIVRDGQTIILNTRSAQALEAAGIPRASWNGVNQTGNQFFENLLNGQLGRNPGGPFDTVRPSGGP
jgi:filamentous hemagglutinin